MKCVVGVFRDPRVLKWDGDIRCVSDRVSAKLTRIKSFRHWFPLKSTREAFLVLNIFLVEEED